MAVEADRQLFTQGDVLRVLGVRSSQLERARHLVVVGDRQQQAIDAETASVLGFHAPDVVGTERRMVAELGVV